MKAPIVAIPLSALGFPPRTRITTAIEVLRRMNFRVEQVGFELVAIRIH